MGDSRSWVKPGQIPEEKLWARQGPLGNDKRCCLRALQSKMGRKNGSLGTPLASLEPQQSNVGCHKHSVISRAIPQLFPLVFKQFPSFAAPILCSYLSRGHSTAAPSASSAKGLCCLRWGWTNQKESESQAALGEQAPSSTHQYGT